MYHPDDQNENKSEYNESESVNRDVDREPPIMGEWHSVSYRSGDSFYTPTEDAPYRARMRKRRVALVAAVVCVCVLFSAVAGFGGALLAKNMYPDLGGGTGGTSNAGMVTDAGGGNKTGEQSEPYENTDRNYDFASALGEISKNNDASLIGSENGSAGNAKKSLIAVTREIKDSVVEISTTTVSNRGTISAGAGSGVIIHKDGIIVTNNHVIEGTDQIIVRLTNGDTYYATVRGTDEQGDIAIIKITPQADKPLTVAKLGNSSALALGEEVIAIGNPLGELGGTVTNGIISALEREVLVDGNTMTLLQTNAAINSGNSGGGLFNMAGELIGVVNAKYAASGVEGLGFAIPIDTVYEDSFGDLFRYGYIRGIPTLGVTLLEHTGGNILNVYYGAYVYDVKDTEGFRTGDYIYSIDGTVVYGINTSAVSAIESIVRSHKVGDVLTVVVRRSGSQVTLTVTLTEYVPEGVGLDIG